MKILDVKKATAPLGKYAQQSLKDIVIITKSGKPLAALISTHGVDLETIALSTNPKFIRLIRQSRDNYRSKGGISASEMRRKTARMK